MRDFQHVCADSGCIYLGQPTTANTCKCHKTTEQVMRAELAEAVRLLDALLGFELNSGGESLAFIERYHRRCGNPPIPSAPDASTPARRPRE